MVELYFENESTKRRYKVVSFDQAAGTVTLIGAHNMPFTEKFSKERFQEMGYTLKQAEAAPPPPADAAPVAVVVG
jgi:hypothetical protein